MSNLRPLFLYLAGSLDERNARLVRAAGYQPIEVTSFDSVKICEGPLPPEAVSVAAQAAFAAISGAVPSSSVPEAFGRKVATALTAKAP